MSESATASGTIIQVGPDLTAQGGVASVIRTYAESSLARDYDIRFATTWRPGKGVGVLAGQVNGVLSTTLKVVFYRGPLLVHVHMASRGSFWRKAVVLSAAMLRGRPTILHLHGGGFESFARSGSWLRRQSIRQIFANATVVAVLSPQWREKVAEFAARPDAIVLPNPVCVPSSRSCGSTPPSVVFLGRLCAQKGTPELVEAIRRLQHQGVEATWVLAGDGDVEQTRALVAGLPDPAAVEVPGWLERDAVAAELREASVFCLPSHSEGKPVALLEAMGHGLACVATPVGGIPDVLADGVTGLSVAPGDVDALTSALKRVLTEPGLGEALGTTARDLVLREYDAEVVAATVGRLYSSLFAMHSTGQDKRGVVHQMRAVYEGLPAPARRAAGTLARTLPVSARYGSAFVRTMRELDRVPGEDLQAAVDERLRGVSEAAMATSYWPRVFREAGLLGGPRSVSDLKSLPLMDKSTVREYSEQLTSTLVLPADRKWVTTGGTSGAPLGMWIERDASVVDWAYTVSAWGRVGFRLDEPRVVLRGVRLGEGRERELAHYEPIRRELYLSVFDMDAEGLARMRAAIARFRPRFIHGYPSALAALGASYQESGESPPTLNAILAVSENVTPDLRERLERTWGCRLFSFYGMTEKGAFAAECEYSTELHVEPLFGVVELIAEDGSVIESPGRRGEIVVTSLVTRAMPLFRYRTGDYASWSAREVCECGRPHRRLVQVEGRWRNERLFGVGGEAISMTALNVHCDAFNHVRRFQFRQDEPGKAVLLLEPTASFRPERDEQKILEVLRGKLDGRIELSVMLVDRVPQTERGKQLFIDQRIPEGAR